VQSSTAVQITDRLVLSRNTAPVGGSRLRGYLEVVNRTGAPIVLRDLCDGWLVGGLANSHVRFEPVSGDVACAAGHLPVGTSRTPVKIVTTYVDCHQDAYSAPSDTPRCLGAQHNHMPALPAGRYITHVLTTTDPVLPTPASITVTLIN
jgi:hypothetical protein